MKKIIVAVLLILIYLVPLSIAAWLVMWFIPKRIAALVLGFGGVTVMMIGPFIAMKIEKWLKQKFVIK